MLLGGQEFTHERGPRACYLVWIASLWKVLSLPRDTISLFSECSVYRNLGVYSQLGDSTESKVK